MASLALSNPDEAASGNVSSIFRSLFTFLVDLLHRLTNLIPSPSPKKPLLPSPPSPSPSLQTRQSEIQQPAALTTTVMTQKSLQKPAQPPVTKLGAENVDMSPAWAENGEGAGRARVGGCQKAPQATSHLASHMARLALEDVTNSAGGAKTSVDAAASVTAGHTPDDSPKLPIVPVIPVSPLPALLPQPLADGQELSGENAAHARFMREALDMAHLALKTNETPVGCVLVYRGRVVAKGMNATNITRNGTRHAEYMAIGALLSFAARGDVEVERRHHTRGSRGGISDERASLDNDTASWGDVDPRDGHLYPYGQKLHPSPRVSRSLIAECVLYVTVEPCVMCASLLRQLGIRKVYFGAVNDKFGGTGGVFRIHMNANWDPASTPSSPRDEGDNACERATPGRPTPHAGAAMQGITSPPGGKDGDEDVVRPPAQPHFLEGHGGNVEPGYDVEGGWGRDEAVTLLRQFYVQENGRAPVPRKKEGRAARLAAMMERDGHAGGPMIESAMEAANKVDDSRGIIVPEAATEAS